MQSPIIWKTASEEETINAGRAIAGIVGNDAVVLLIGELGAGKTTLAKGIVNELNGTAIAEVSSPTFTLIHEYRGDPKVYHIDLYRLEEAREVETLGLDDLFGRTSVVLIEWGERFPQLLPEDRWEVYLEYEEADADELAERRTIRLEKKGAPPA
jgi:tRNA threonylcarbamoyladenosine biosynthesis protein TsaE